MQLSLFVCLYLFVCCFVGCFHCFASFLGGGGGGGGGGGSC